MSIFENSMTPFNSSTSLYERSASLYERPSMSGLGEETLDEILKKLKDLKSGGTTKTKQGIFPSGWLGDILNGVISNSGTLMEVYTSYSAAKDDKKFRKEMQNRLRESMSDTILTGPPDTTPPPSFTFDPRYLDNNGDDKPDEDKDKTMKMALLIGAGGLAFVTVLLLVTRKRK